MPFLYITEFADLGLNPRGGVTAVPLLPASAGQRVTTSGTSAQSTNLAATTNLVRLISDADCSVLVGTNPTATIAAGLRLLAGQPEYFGVTPATTTKIAAIV